MTTAIQTIWLEHVNIGSVLSCLRFLVSELEAGRWRPDFQLFADVLDYIEDFAEAMHHPKEGRRTSAPPCAGAGRIASRCSRASAPSTRPVPAC